MCILRGITVSDKTLALDVIREIGPGGHFLDHPRTLEMFRGEFFMLKLFDRRSPQDWQASGSKHADQVAGERVQASLDEEPAWLLPPGADDALYHCLIAVDQEHS